MKSYIVHYIINGMKVKVKVLAASSGAAFDTVLSFVPNAQIYRVDA